MDIKGRFVYSVSLKEANAMDELEKQFLQELLQHRMEVHYQRICDAKTYQQRKEELKFLEEMEEKYQKVLASLGAEDKEIIKVYVEDVSDRATEETERYYHCGFEDGLKLMGALIRYYIR